ncbi:MAG: DUF5685 family protein [Clostridia bacterium]|nr:DUF5685 family protein [Clostridia bacterium]
MFGYVTPDKPYLYIKDFTLYKSVYCGICKSLKQYGTLPRITTNYDSVFLSILLHNYLNIDYNIKRQNCILHPLKKRNIAQTDELSKLIVSISVMLVYHKFTDDIIDGEGFFKRLLRFFTVKRAYKKAKKLLPAADKVITEEYNRLRAFEKENCSSIDMVSDCFAMMMQKLCPLLLKETDSEMERLFYSIGKWVYLIDALDDLEKDKKNGNYNPLIAAYGSFDDLAEFKTKIKTDLQFTFNCIFNTIEESFNNIKFNFNTDIIRNVLFGGLKTRTNLLMENIKCTKIRI